MRRATGISSQATQTLQTQQTPNDASCTINLEGLLSKRLGTIARLSGRTVEQVTTRALEEWMETTGELLIEFGTNRLPKVEESKALDNLLIFAVPDNQTRAGKIMKTHKHRPQVALCKVVPGAAMIPQRAARRA